MSDSQSAYESELYEEQQKRRIKASMSMYGKGQPAKKILVISRVSGYAHTRYSGTCPPDVTVEDIKSRFYDPCFGGRDAWVRGGEWGCVRHND